VAASREASLSSLRCHEPISARRDTGKQKSDVHAAGNHFKGLCKHKQILMVPGMRAIILPPPAKICIFLYNGETVCAAHREIIGHGRMQNKKGLSASFSLRRALAWGVKKRMN